eukprot:TRINITY_DN14133_c0_g1_i1.p1 TRINITY_DN14133_c0_g1~~TRINITY_DN14133_c0_g1_i1.p1  ORF type:complete len:427 (-),score=110.05 TRINITY_DN14133_c0_g1_i1:88-1368(-)
MAELELKSLQIDDGERQQRNDELLRVIKQLDANDATENWIGEYTMSRTLGKGSTAVVRLAQKRASPTEQAAIKIIDLGAIAQNADAKKRVEREVTLLRRLQHPYLMQLYDTIDTKTHRYIILEYLPGGELFDYLMRQGGRLPMDETFKIWFQLVIAIAFLHNNRVVHRDIKMENLLLDKLGNVKLADFGMACPIPASGFLDESVGSPHYACPEIIKGSKYNGTQADVWSLGVVLYALLTSTLPFSAENQSLMFAKIKAADYKIPAELPDPAQEVLRNTIALQPQERWTLQEVQASPFFRSRAVRIAPEMRALWEAEFPPENSADTLHARLLSPHMKAPSNLQQTVDVPCGKCGNRVGLIVAATMQMKGAAAVAGLPEPPAEYACQGGCGQSYLLTDGCYHCDCTPEGWNCSPSCAQQMFDKEQGRA